jgi:hypothetical protein
MTHQERATKEAEARKNLSWFVKKYEVVAVLGAEGGETAPPMNQAEKEAAKAASSDDDCWITFRL